MFKKEKKQYINIIRDDKHIKVDGSIYINLKLYKNENSSFLIKEKDAPSSDLITKLQIVEKDISKTYISTITFNTYQKIILKEELQKDLYEYIALGDNYNIVIPKNEIENEKFYFNNHIDYIFSPFTFLYEQTAAKASKNSLNVIIKENRLFMFLFDQNKNIRTSKVSRLTPIESIKESKFYQDEIAEQKLYEEVFFLELQQTLSDFVQSYYQEFKDTEFLEEINIFYTINRINDDQLDLLHETLMAKVNYYNISLEDKIKILSLKPNANDYSFIASRTKKEPANTLLWASTAAASVLLTVGILYFKSQEPTVQETKIAQTTQKTEQPEQTEKKVEENTTKQISALVLPDHKAINQSITNEIKYIFDLVAEDAILKELQLDSKNSTIVCNFIADSTTPAIMQENLQKNYASSKIILSHQNEAILSSIITNEEKLINNDALKLTKTYSPLKYVSAEKFTTYLQSILPENSKIEFLNSTQNEFTSYDYTITLNVKSPDDFFALIEKLNNDQIPININYPVEFAKMHDIVNIKFNLHYHQKNR